MLWGPGGHRYVAAVPPPSARRHLPPLPRSIATQKTSSPLVTLTREGVIVCTQAWRQRDGRADAIQDALGGSEYQRRGPRLVRCLASTSTRYHAADDVAPADRVYHFAPPDRIRMELDRVSTGVRSAGPNDGVARRTRGFSVRRRRRAQPCSRARVQSRVRRHNVQGRPNGTCGGATRDYRVRSRAPPVPPVSNACLAL
jgi:hypothetical protein